MLNSDCKLTEIVKKTMIHNFYEKLNSSALCIKFNKHDCIVCLKRYSCQLQSETIINVDEYSLYHYSADEHQIIKQMKNVCFSLNNE